MKPDFDAIDWAVPLRLPGSAPLAPPLGWNRERETPMPAVSLAVLNLGLIVLLGRFKPKG